MKRSASRSAPPPPPPAPPPVVPLPDEGSELVRRQIKAAQRAVSQRTGYTSTLLSGGSTGDRLTVSAPGRVLLGQ